MTDANETRCAGRVTFSEVGSLGMYRCKVKESVVLWASGDYVPAATADALLAALRAVEWGGTLGDRCPSCGNVSRIGHAPDCRLAAALALAEGR